MRIYNNCVEAISEICRDLFSRGTVTLDPTRQGRFTDDPQKELIGYSYMITKWLDKEELLNWARNSFDKTWLNKTVAEAWSSELIYGPEYSLSYSKEFWELDDELRNYFKKWVLRDGTDPVYRYGERIHAHNQLTKVIDRLKNNPYSRGAIVSIWRVSDLDKSGNRVPCSLEYQFLVREGKLNCILNQRSLDLVTFFALDVYKALRLTEYVAESINRETGTFIHNIGSLHTFLSDVTADRKW